MGLMGALAGANNPNAHPPHATGNSLAIWLRASDSDLAMLSRTHWIREPHVEPPALFVRHVISDWIEFGSDAHPPHATGNSLAIWLRASDSDLAMLSRTHWIREPQVEPPALFVRHVQGCPLRYSTPHHASPQRTRNIVSAKPFVRRGTRRRRSQPRAAFPRLI